MVNLYDNVSENNLNRNVVESRLVH